MQYVKRRARASGITVTDTSKDGVGYDYEFIHPSGKREKIEVKGSSTGLIPDMRTNEFDDNKRLKADYIFLVHIVKNRAKILVKIPRSAVNPDDLRLLCTYRVSLSAKRLAQYAEPWGKEVLPPDGRVVRQ